MFYVLKYSTFQASSLYYVGISLSATKFTVRIRCCSIMLLYILKNATQSIGSKRCIMKSFKKGRPHFGGYGKSVWGYLKIQEYRQF